MVLYFSGTGNSKYIAKRIAEAIQENAVDLNMKIKENDTSPLQTGRDVIIVTPTYAWRIPRIVSEWIDKMEFIGGKRIWFVMNCGSEIGMKQTTIGSFQNKRNFNIWDRHRFSCRRIILPCLMRQKQKKHGKL